MHNLYRKLGKILTLEQQKNFNNSIVIGGLEGFLAFWLAEARTKATDLLDQQKVEEVAQHLHGYGKMAVEERQTHVLYLLERLNIEDAKYSRKAPRTRRPHRSQRANHVVGESSSGYGQPKSRYQARPPAGRSSYDRSNVRESTQNRSSPSIANQPQPAPPGVTPPPVVPQRANSQQPAPPGVTPPPVVPQRANSQQPAPPSFSGTYRQPQKPVPAEVETASASRTATHQPLVESRAPMKPPAPTREARLDAKVEARVDARTLAREDRTLARTFNPIDDRIERKTRLDQARAFREAVAQSQAGVAESKVVKPVESSSEQSSSAASKPKRMPPRRRPLPPEVALKLEQELQREVTTLPGIGKGRAKKLEKLNIRTIYDLLYHVPFRYEDYTTMKRIVELRYGDEVSIAGVVQEMNMYKSQKGTIVVNGMIGDGTGKLRVKWFGNRYIINQLRQGTMVRLSGKIDAYMGRLQMVSPRFEVITKPELKSGLLVPVYSRTEGLSEKALRNYIGMALDQYAGRIPDPLPQEIRDHYELINLSQAVRWVHRATSLEQVRAAQKRLAFDELLRLQLGMLQQRAAWENQPGNTIHANQEVIERFYASLPFTLTGAQQRCVQEILADMGQSWAMSRLLQGDVGSGKTAVAATALLAAVSAGFQAALMAPTEILAEQHFAGVQKFLNPENNLLLGDRPIRFALLTGSLSASEKREAREAIAKGEADVIIGTHALIQDDVTYPNLGLAVVDEQHRFGVKQRSALRKRTQNDTTPDLLVMSATPIPRSLALTVYGDLELSIIDEMPPGRQPIVTRAITPELRERAYTYIRRQIQQGRQAFIICPLVEESEKLEARAAIEEHRFLQQEIFPEYSVELLHGRMKPSEKEAAMGRFYRNESQILVSTSVVEVGIDVPNANVMLIEGANRFGLAQLHQFRGRVGRGKWRSLCLLMAEENISEEGEQRLQVLVENADGFALAEEDLKMRGPGDFFGTRQSGLLDLKIAKLGDTQTLSKARTVAKQIIHHDAELNHPAHQLLRAQTESYWNKENDGVS